MGWWFLFLAEWGQGTGTVNLRSVEADDALKQSPSPPTTVAFRDTASPSDDVAKRNTISQALQLHYKRCAHELSILTSSNFGTNFDFVETALSDKSQLLCEP